MDVFYQSNKYFKKQSIDIENALNTFVQGGKVAYIRAKDD
jgi:hypothetical protein